MKDIVIFALFTLIFSGCFNPKITKEDCEKENKTFYSKKMLNFRTGEYENRNFCLDKEY